MFFASPSYCSLFALNTEQPTPGIRTGDRKASSAHFLNSTDLQISPGLFCDGEGPYKNKYSIRPTWEIFHTMKLLGFLSWTSPLCDAEDAQRKSTEWRSRIRTSTWYKFGPHCAREKKIVFSAGHCNERTRESIALLFRKL